MTTRTRAKMSFTLAPEAADKLRELAAANGSTMSAVLDELILGGVTSSEADRRGAWDRFAASWTGERRANPESCARLADMMLAERDKRFPR